MRAVLAVDVGGTYVRMGVFRGGGAVDSVVRVRHSTADAHCVEVSEVARAIVEYGNSLRPSDRVSAVGVAVAGPVDSGRRCVLVAENLGWRDVDLAGELEGVIGVPVSIDTDVFCAARAECLLGAGRGSDSVLYVAMGTGIGHALVLGGSVVRGAHGAASLFGHMPLVDNGRPCYCGRSGCLCQYASGRGIASQWASQATETGRTAEIPAEHVVVRAQRGCKPARGILDHGLALLARAIGCAVTVMDPDVVVLGGGAVSPAWPELSRLRERTRQYSHDLLHGIEVVQGELEPYSTLLGAGLNAWQTLKLGVEDGDGY